jgi:regulatory protein
VRRIRAGSADETSARPDPWQVALKQLANRARSADEIRRALARRGYDRNEVEAVLARLTASRYLDDAEFARTWVTTRARRSLMGPARLARELRAKGIPEGDISAALRSLAEEWDSREAGREAVRRKLPSLQGLPPAVARRRLATFLERRGFNPEVILAMCRRQFADVEEPRE